MPADVLQRPARFTPVGTAQPHGADATVAIVGGGISGLVAAWSLAQRGVSTVVFEATDRVGGVIRSEDRDGRLVELGPHTAQCTDAIATLVNELSLETRLVQASPSGRRRYIARRNELHVAPLSPPALIRTRLLSFGAKLRLLREPFITRGTDPDETLAEFVRRRFGGEPLSELATPFVRGVWAGDPFTLSASLAFPRLAAFERDSGSIVRGALRAAGRSRRSKRSAPQRLRGSVSFSGGMAELPACIASALGQRVICDATVSRLVTHGDGWSIEVERAQGRRERYHAKHVILATPAYALPQIDDPRVDLHSVAAIAETEYAPVASITLGFRRVDVDHRLDGFGLLVADREPRALLGALFTSSLFPGRCPNDEVLITCFVGGSAARDAATAPTESVLPVLQKDLALLLGVRGSPTFVAHARRHRAIPQYTLAHANVLESACRVEAACSRLTFAGNWRTGISVGDCVSGGRAAADRAHQAVGAR